MGSDFSTTVNEKLRTIAVTARTEASTDTAAATSTNLVVVILEPYERQDLEHPTPPSRPNIRYFRCLQTHLSRLLQRTAETPARTLQSMFCDEISSFFCDDLSHCQCQVHDVHAVHAHSYLSSVTHTCGSVSATPQTRTFFVTYVQ